MKNYRKHIDDFFKEKLGRYTETPPPDVWDALEGRLDTLVPAAPPSYRWLKHFGIITLIVVLSVSLFRKMSGPSSSENIVLKENTIAKVQATVPASGGSATVGNETPGPDNTQAAGTAAISPVDAEETNVTATHATAPLTHQSPTGKVKVYNSTGRPLTNTTSAGKPSGAVSYQEPVQENSARGKAGSSGPMEEVAESNTTITPGHSTPEVKKEIAQLPKTTNDNPTATFNQDRNEKKINKHSFPRFEAGVKLGYERGYSDEAAAKYLVAPYLQYNVSQRVSVMIQPAVKYAALDVKAANDTSYYYKPVSATAQQMGNSVKGYIREGGSIKDSFYTTNYRYTRLHDSSARTYKYGGNYMEFELPVLLKYAVTKNFSVYGGVNINYSKLVSSNKYNSPVTRVSVSVDSANTSIGAPRHLPINTVVPERYTGTQYSGEAKDIPSMHANAPGSFFRMGYMAGFSYEYSHRWLFDALIQQTPAIQKVKGDYDARSNTALSAPYIRLSVGYKLTK